MKKTSYILGIISICFILVATIFKAMHLPGAGTLLTLGLGFISLVFLPTAYFNLRKSTEDKLLRAVYLTAFISFFIDFIGALFKIMHWPGAAKLLIIGVPLPFVLFLPTYIYYHNKRKLKTDTSFFSILLFMIYLGVFSSLLAVNYGKNFIYSYISTAESINTNTKSLEGLFNPSNECTQLVEQIEQLKVKLIKHSYKDDVGVFENDKIINYKAIIRKDARMNIYFVAEKEFKAFNLGFEKYTGGFVNSMEAKRLINEINRHRKENLEGEHAAIANLPLFMSLNILSDWQNKILLMDFIDAENL